MTKETLLALADDLSIEKIDSLIQTLYSIKFYVHLCTRHLFMRVI
ncbi:MAG: hypothetical protein SFZ02_19455 [bacterium]|nr:hypothetical protein [bacterium]